jgi:hypothetical protein
MSATTPVWVLDELAAECARQDAQRGGAALWPDGTGDAPDRAMAELVRQMLEDKAAEGRLTWSHLLYRRMWDALAEVDPARLRGLLLRLAASAVRWVAAIDRRSADDGSTVDGAE